MLLDMLLCPRMPTTQLRSSLADRRHNGAMVVGWTKKKMNGGAGSKRCLSVVETDSAGAAMRHGALCSSAHSHILTHIRAQPNKR